MTLVRCLPVTLPLLFGFAFLLTPAPIPVPDDTTLDPAQKKEIIQKVFKDLVNAVDPPAPLPPRLEIADIEDGWALCIPEAGVIRIDERVYDICRTFGEDSLSALAAILGHELGHYYLHHDRISTRQRRARMGDISNITRQRTQEESEADYFGGLYSYLAGYNTLDITPAVIHRLYDSLSLPDSIPGYLPKGERKAVASRIQDSLRKFLPFFDTGLYLALTRQFPEAQLCYRRILQIFPGREIANNSGVIYVLQALDLMASAEAGYIYPLELDDDTRLIGTNIPNGVFDRPRRVPGPYNQQLADILLDSAEEKFRYAMRKDEKYSTAVINLATVHILKHDYIGAIKLVQGVMDSDTTLKTRSLASVVLSIALSLNKSPHDAREAMESARRNAGQTDAAILVQANSAVLEKETFAVPSGGEYGNEESIGNIRPEDTSMTWQPDLDKPVGGIYGLKIIHKGSPTRVCDLYRAEKSSSWAQFISTRERYYKTTARGVAVGDPADSVKSRYGGNPRIVRARQGSYYIYDYSKIIFLIGEDGKVRRWIIYTVA